MNTGRHRRLGKHSVSTVCFFPVRLSFTAVHVVPRVSGHIISWIIIRPRSLERSRSIRRRASRSEKEKKKEEIIIARIIDRKRVLQRNKKKRGGSDRNVGWMYTFLVLLFEQHLELVIVESVSQGVEDRPHFFLLDPPRLGRIEHGEGSPQHCKKQSNFILLSRWYIYSFFKWKNIIWSIRIFVRAFPRGKFTASRVVVGSDKSISRPPPRLEDRSILFEVECIRIPWK